MLLVIGFVRKILYFPCFILWVISFVTQCTKMKAFSLEARLSQVFLYFADFVWIIWSEARAILCCTKMFSIKGCFDDRNLPIQVRFIIVMSCLLNCRLGMQRNAIERFQPIGLNSSLPTLPQLLKQGGYATHMVSLWHT